VIGNADFYDVIDDTVTFTDTYSGSFAYFVDTDESVTFSDTYGVLRKVNVTVVDAAGFTDIYTVVANFNPTVNESIFLMEMACATGWFVINDSQTPKC
jgi:hypothetical protein